MKTLLTPRKALAALLLALGVATGAVSQAAEGAGDRMRTLEREIATLRDLSARHRIELDRLSGATHLSPVSVHGPWALLGALLATAVVAAACVAHGASAAARKRAQAARWGEAPGTEPAAFARVDRTDSTGPVPAPWPADVALEHGAGVDLPSPAAPVAVAPAPREELAPLAFEHVLPQASAPAPARAAHPAGQRTKVLAEVLQEAGFLVSLGGMGQAIDVLRSYVECTREAPALALLELRELCRQAGDDEGVAAVEQDFRARFGVEPPHDDASPGLEACDAAVARVVAAWLLPRVLDVIEDLLFGPPAALGGLPGLHAWRDLLWLHGLARDTLYGSRAGPPLAHEVPEMTLDLLVAAEGRTLQVA